nr:type II toxin-antitoxin system prevent-host-death family antitoxin [Streptacidiphilus jiangxiensis]
MLLAVRAFVVGGVGQSCSVSRVAALDAVENDAEELVITRAGHEPLVVVSLAEYASLRETDYLLRSPANAEHLRRSLQEYQQGRAQARELIDPEDLSEQTA